MKRIKNISLLLLVLLLSAAPALWAQSELQQKMAAIPEITEVETLESTEFPEKYVVYFTQPLDHNHPEVGSFRQRVIVSHVGFDHPTIIVTEGYGAAYGLNPKYREELSKMYDTNMIFVEYRYFLESTPDPLDWSYLTAESSADDLHAVRDAFKQIYPGKWIATGISKGGQTTMLYRTFYPDDVDISVPYVAPLCYGVEDGRHEPFISNVVGTPEERQKVEDFQREVLKRRETLEPMFEAHCKEKGFTFRTSMDEIYDLTVLEYSFALWQWGISVETIPALTESDEVLFDHFIKISTPSYFAIESPEKSFFVQAARELGYYGYDTRPFEEYLSIRSAKGYLNRLLLPDELQEMTFDPTLGNKIKKFLTENDPKMIFLYGENDPWSAAGVTWLEGKENIHVFIQPRGSHATRIGTLPEEMQKEVKALLDQWLAE